MTEPTILSAPDFMSKLPRYAQDWMVHALADLKYLRQRLAVAEGTSAPGPSEVRAGLGGWSSTKDLVSLPPRTEIVFTTGLGYGEELSFRMPTTRDQGWVEVAAGGGATTILSRPGASNVLYLKAFPHDASLDIPQ